MSHRIKMRLTGTQADLEVWVELVRKMAKHRVVELLEVSAPYANEGESQFYRCYLEVDLLVDPSTAAADQGSTAAPPDPGEEPPEPPAAVAPTATAEPAPSTKLPAAKPGRRRTRANK